MTVPAVRGMLSPHPVLLAPLLSGCACVWKCQECVDGPGPDDPGKNHILNQGRAMRSERMTMTARESSTNIRWVTGLGLLTFTFTSLRLTV
ncbi:hypothetical protein BO82DRAFT_155080 [Aspergillus uvarum CBS 121591]|uniref:Secreted protein n=1 Tax=Aspergillus uvarum CBS 121591 TaxID=1448315 RepID=A0A319C3U3_9EURO|nr:hypothetical protein BO82DRAFT_155080 [Aspergillus uvarum CBS 121591]PYH78529.1 hypothetical protein BO82DRAFT_155080 [Aspergillus uvarum CBS 121591]